MAGPGAVSSLVLVIRGELLRRYPNTIIYAAEAVAGDTPGTFVPGDNEKYPQFGGTLAPDVTFIGFELTRRKPSPLPAGSSCFRSNPQSRVSVWTWRVSPSRNRMRGTSFRGATSWQTRRRSKS
jgi:hypothetical protein